MPKHNPEDAATKATAPETSLNKDEVNLQNKSGVNNPKSSPNSKIDIAAVTQQLLDNYSATPEKLDKLVSAETQHTEILQQMIQRLSEIKRSLNPGQNAIDQGLAIKLTPVERTKLMNERTKLLSLKRKLLKSNRIISVELIGNAKNERKEIRITDLRDKVKDPNYYRKYGKYIVPSFTKWLGNSMTKELLDKLTILKSTKPADFNDALAKLLLFENHELYIKSTGSKEARTGYFAEFKKVFDKWQPKSAKIKK
jgi:hypothetical protein